ncbi:MAG TPA: tyrosine-type recombinase/integrase, partial [Rubrobacteraceae bacterium]|nr:tyrosine-type recombinase/integrase [Rubrobacteraceae bacterium]
CWRSSLAWSYSGVRCYWLALLPNGGYRSSSALLSRYSGMQVCQTFHALRHSFATLMLSGREHPKVVQEMLGHSRINTTLDFYSHVLPDMQREAVDRLDMMLS